ncbi:MAG: hypothetical protein NTU44_15625 [Bacteroidetes bacterium]|nr:hypothetical protein [Bacteroidota bacterium]
MAEIKFTRQDLYELVWSESMLSLSKRYDISDNGLRKICKRMEIPLPANGHWQKVQYGKDVIKQKLPKNSTVEQEVTLQHRAEA